MSLKMSEIKFDITWVDVECPYCSWGETFHNGDEINFNDLLDLYEEVYHTCKKCGKEYLINYDYDDN